MEKSAVWKKIIKMPQNTLIEVYMSEIRLVEEAFEVCLNQDEALEKGSLKKGHTDWNR